MPSQNQSGNAGAAAARAALRQQADSLIADNPSAAAACLAELWRADSGPATASFVIARFERMRERLPLIKHRLAILRSFTVEPAAPLLRAGAFCADIDVAVQIGDFNSYAQELLDPDSSLYRFSPDSVILAVQTRDIAPDLYDEFSGLAPNEVDSAVARVVEELQRCVESFRAHSSANLVIHTLDVPASPRHGLLDQQMVNGQSAAIGHINEELRSLAARHHGVYLLDSNALVARIGQSRWYDERKWLTMRLPITGEGLACFANEWLRYLHPLSGRV